MARKSTERTLRVFLNSRLVGRISKRRSGAIYFQYDADWLSWENTMPISMSLPLTERRYSGDEVIAVIDNLLPDEPTVRSAIAEKFDAIGTDPYSLLATIGRDCVGALQFLPDGIERTPDAEINATEVSDESIAEIVSNLFRSPLGLKEAEDEDFRISIAGAQEKTALLKRDGKWYRPHGTTPTTHILKPAIGLRRDGLDLSTSVENEFYCLLLLKTFGLQVNEVEIADFVGTKALVVERFDRFWTKDGRLLRLPQEDMCQALSVNSASKYQANGGPGIISIMRFLTGSDEAVKDRRTFFMAQVLFWLIGATDGHAKNFSILLRPNNRFELAPLYDVMTLQPAIDQKQFPHKNFKLAMAVGEHQNYLINYITSKHFLRAGRDAGLSIAQIHSILSETCERAEEVLEQVRNELPTDFPENIHESVSAAVLSRRNRLTFT